MTDGIWPRSGRTEQDGISAPTPKRQTRRGARRNIFEGTYFFTVPIALIDLGIARVMKPSHFIRYVTLCRVANWSSSEEIVITSKELSGLDGVAPRTARQAHGKLQEYGMICITKTRPFTYRLVTLPELWKSHSWIKPRLTRSFAARVETV
jgi:hypothetical protein